MFEGFLTMVYIHKESVKVYPNGSFNQFFIGRTNLTIDETFKI